MVRLNTTKRSNKYYATVPKSDPLIVWSDQVVTACSASREELEVELRNGGEAKCKGLSGRSWCVYPVKV
ncbi:hypothetical protein NECAME_11526 [Necator americanus]|uniref:Uncharacterized protein n=1 Tax=Necator americanus TaxID=51031 RepID=W2T3Q1_NECAM|nr:hypothetical protein NECAME_11526 [Necator americanus]ETN76640.1 hypothetical protein NECAME_11526 [Necator americanus]